MEVYTTVEEVNVCLQIYMMHGKKLIQVIKTSLSLYDSIYVAVIQSVSCVTYLQCY